MWDAKSPWSMRFDETVCAALCQHPSCWQSTNRKAKGIPRVVPNVPPSEEIETDLPTLKVCNMLDDYGDDPRDQFPSKHEGKPKHMRTALPLPSLKNPNRSSSIKVTATPVASPSSQVKKQTREKKEMKLVEVQEVFELEDLNSNWDDTFVSKQYYVWVPNPKNNGKKKILKEQPTHIDYIDEPTNLQSICDSTKVPPSGQIMVRDITETMIPKEIEYERLNTKSTEEYHDFPILKKKRAMSPLMSGLRRTPYSKGSSYGFRSAGHGRPMFDADGLEELLSLPRDVLIHVLNHSKSSDFTSRERIREMIQRFLPPLERGFTDLSTESTDLLTQRKMNLHESKTRNIRQPNLMETKPVFYLDEDGVGHEIMAKSQGQGMQIFDSEYGSIRDLYMTGARDFPKFKNPLPPIGDNQDASGVKIPSISLGLPELPSGIRQTKPFTYKRNTNQFDFTLAPVPTPPTSVRDVETPGSEHGTTIRVNVPSASERPPLDVPTPVFPEEKKSPITVPVETRAESQQSRTPRGALHAVSPAHSTKVPHAPATTPATSQQTPVKTANRDGTTPGTKEGGTTNDQVVSRETTGLSSPKQPAPPANSPHFTPEHTGLDTIEETRQEGTTEQQQQQQPHPVSRGGRSVRFAAEVPEVPPPPSSPQEPGDVDDFYQSTLTTPLVQDVTDAKPQSGISMLTTQNTFHTEQELSDQELIIKSARKREVSDLSTPEPWPQINEADFDTTPAPPPSSKQSMHPSETADDTQVNNNSRVAVIDAQSDRNVDSKAMSMSDLESIDSKEHKKSEEVSRKSESPGPPPPSPEPKDHKKLTVEESKSARKIKSRESVAMTPLPEESDMEESHDTQVRTIVVEVPPLGQPTTKKKTSSHKNRTIDTFINVDIPAGQKDTFSESKNNNGLKDKKIDIVPTVTEVPEEDTATINTRDVDMSVQSSVGGQTMDRESVMSDITSAGVDPSIGGNVSPTSTLNDSKVGNIDLKLIGDPNGAATGPIESQETIPETDEQEKVLEAENTEITEDGGDHEGFKQELQEEYDKLSSQET